MRTPASPLLSVIYLVKFLHDLHPKMPVRYINMLKGHRFCSKYAKGGMTMTRTRKEVDDILLDIWFAETSLSGSEEEAVMEHLLAFLCHLLGTGKEPWDDND
jgi:hypothetical protein